MQKFQRQGCLLIAPVLDNTPTEALEVIYDIKPLNLILEKMAVEKYLNTRGTFKRRWEGQGSDGKYFGHIHQCRKLMEEFGLEEVENDHKKDICLRKTYKVDLAKTDHPTKEGLVIYTDGSKMDQGVGFGYHYTDPEYGYYEELGALRKEGTVFQAEIMALKKAAERMIRVSTKDQKITIYTDSQAALMAMDSRMTSSRLVHETKVKWNHVGTYNQVTLHWIKAHVGHEGNELADNLAKDGIKFPETPVLLTKAWIKSFLKEKLIQKWDKQWLQTGPDKYRHTKMWLPKITTPLRGGVLKFHNRKVVGLLAQWITSFNNMNYHTWRKNKQGSVLPACRLCQKADSFETAWHLATECEGAAVLSRLHLHIFTEDETKWSWDSLKAFLLSPTIYRLVTTRTADT